jgi:ATP-dependent helicase/nuclease subunit B
MLLSNQLLEENVYAIAGVLSSLEKNVTLSYSCRDLREDRELFPSSLLLGVYRLITTDRGGDYSALIKFIGAPAGFVPEPDVTPLNDWEWWFSQKQAGYGSKSVHGCYPHLLEGERAESSRDQEKLSEYDGWIPSAAGSMDPLKPDAVLSCSRLEALAKCPYAFFIRHILGIEALEEVQKDMNRWLDPLQRGELLHEVFYRFMTALKSKEELPELKTHLGLLETIAKEEVERWKAEVPPASEMALNRELRDMKLALEIFLKNEEQHCKTSEPCFFELSFGMAAEKTPGISTQDPVKIDLQPKGSFNLRGRIDRVDRCAEHEYEVWDYKTGGKRGYREEGYLNRGRHLQHALYAAAAEILLRRNQDEKARVVRAGYFFPSPKGEGFRIEKDQTAREEISEVMGDLFELLRSGVFPATYDKDSCGICDYDSICGGSELAVERSKMKLAKDKKMQPLERLKGHA